MCQNVETKLHLCQIFCLQISLLSSLDQMKEEILRKRTSRSRVVRNDSCVTFCLHCCRHSATVSPCARIPFRIVFSSSPRPRFPVGTRFDRRHILELSPEVEEPEDSRLDQLLGEAVSLSTGSQRKAQIPGRIRIRI